MNYESEGKIKILGCSLFKGTKFYDVYFRVGSRVYVKKKALIGILESVVIKKINRILPKKYTYQGIQPAITYTDTLNRIWIEEELIWKENAIDFARIHWERLGKKLENECIT
jgi:hypothetical protein